MATKRLIKVFIASPGDLAVERQTFRELVADLNAGFADGAGVEFQPLGWEDVLSTVGVRSQSVINSKVDECDVFILAISRRWGQPAPDSSYTSYTEEEFHRAVDRRNKTGAPEIFIFFKDVDAEAMADPGRELRRVLAFRRKLEKKRLFLYRTFHNEAGFRNELDIHLRAYVRGEVPSPNTAGPRVAMPPDLIRRVKAARSEARRQKLLADAANSRAEAKGAEAAEYAMMLAHQAARAALDGRVEEARQCFAKVAADTRELDILHLAFVFYCRTGDLAQGEQLLKRWLAIGGPAMRTAETAGALGNLGIIHLARGQLGEAELRMRESLAIAEELKWPEGVALAYGNLGQVFRARGDLDQAERAFEVSMQLNKETGNDENLALGYADLGMIYWTRGDLDKAESLIRQSLRIYERLGHPEGISLTNSHYGLINRERGDLDWAQRQIQKSLEIATKLGQPEGIARACANLGLICRTRGDLDTAQDLLESSLRINEEYARREGVANDYGDLGIIQWLRGDLERAEEMLQKSLEINLMLNRQEATARVCDSLGMICSARGDDPRAGDCWKAARSLYERVGLTERAAEVTRMLNASGRGRAA